MGDQETGGRSKNYYARTAWTLFIVSLVLDLTANNIFGLPTDATRVAWAFAMIGVITSFLIVLEFSGNGHPKVKVDMRKVSRVYGLAVCPLFFIITILSFFVAWPHDNVEVIHPRETPFSLNAEEVQGFRFYNPFEMEVQEYDLDAYTSYDSVLLFYEYNGSAMDFHLSYGIRSRTQEFGQRVDSVFKEAVEEFKRIHQEAPRFQLLCWLDSELPRRLPADVKYTGRLSLAARTIIWSPIGSKDE